MDVLRTRLLSATLLVPLVLLVVVVGDPWFSLLLGIIAFLAMVEVVGLLDAAGFQPPQVLTILGGLAVTAAGLAVAGADRGAGPLARVLDALDPPGLVVAVLVTVVLLLAIAALTRAEPRSGFVTWAMSSFGVAYIGVLLPFLTVVAHLAPSAGSSTTAVGPLSIPSGLGWMLTLLLVVWGYDTGAYLVGRWLGRRKLIGHISPSKTVEGFVGGLVLATIAALVGAAVVGLEAWHALAIGPVVGVAAQAGDLAESMLKRAADRKESGVVIPGHGGILDRIDSFLFAAPVLAGYAVLVAGRGA